MKLVFQIQIVLFILMHAFATGLSRSIKSSIKKFEVLLIRTPIEMALKAVKLARLKKTAYGQELSAKAVFVL